METYPGVRFCTFTYVISSSDKTDCFISVCDYASPKDIFRGKEPYICWGSRYVGHHVRVLTVPGLQLIPELKDGIPFFKFKICVGSYKDLDVILPRGSIISLDLNAQNHLIPKTAGHRFDTLNGPDVKEEEQFIVDVSIPCELISIGHITVLYKEVDSDEYQNINLIAISKLPLVFRDNLMDKIKEYIHRRSNVKNLPAAFHKFIFNFWGGLKGTKAAARPMYLCRLSKPGKPFLSHTDHADDLEFLSAVKQLLFSDTGIELIPKGNYLS